MSKIIGKSIVLCNYDQRVCATVTAADGGNVIIGSTLHSGTTVLTEDRFLNMLATGDVTSAIKAILNADEIAAMISFDGPAVIAEAKALAGLPIVAAAELAKA
jgi:hypothetical protein